MIEAIATKRMVKRVFFIVLNVYNLINKIPFD